MGSNYFSTVVDEKIDNFITSFVSTAKKLYVDTTTGELRHSGEYGVYRERSCVELIEMFIPLNFGISDGFIINKHDNVSTQCDIIIYDKNKMPRIGVDKNRVFLSEAVVGVIEVKSVVDSTLLKEALTKLSRIKAYKYESTPDNPHSPLTDMFTAVICHNYSSSLEKLTEFLDTDVYSEDFNQRNKHNLILSIKDGIIGYDCSKAKEKYEWLKGELEKPNNLPAHIREKAIYEIGDMNRLEWRFNKYPTIFNVNLASTFDRIVEGNRHIKAFLNHIHRMTIDTKTTHPSFVEYLNI